MTGDPGNTAGGTMHTLAGGSAFPTTWWTMVIARRSPGRGSLRSVSRCELVAYATFAAAGIRLTKRRISRRSSSSA